MAISLTIDLGLGPPRGIGALAGTDLTAVQMFVDPLRQRHRCGQPGHRVERAFFVEKVPTVGHAEAAGSEPVGALCAVALVDDANQKLAECPQCGTHTVLDAIEPQVDVGDGSAVCVTAAAAWGGRVDLFVGQSHRFVVGSGTGQLNRIAAGRRVVNRVSR